MAAPSRTSLPEIVAAGARLLESGGLDGLTMQAVARAVGVRAPSLYKHVADRDELVRLIAEHALADLGARLDAAAPDGVEPREGMRAAAHALRRFARERPAAFRLVFAPGAEATRPSPDVAYRATATVLRLGERLAGAEEGLAAARTVTAWASGFIAMELAGAFRIPGDVDHAFEFGITRLADALAGAAAGR